MSKISTSDRLKQLMRERNLKQVDILNLAQPYCECHGVKLGRNDLSQYVAGKVVPGQNKLFILAKALNVDEAWLMGYDVPQNKNERTSEETIIKKYNKLNDIGKNKTDAYIDGLLENPSYRTGGVKMVAEMPVSVPPKVIKRKRHT